MLKTCLRAATLALALSLGGAVHGQAAAPVGPSVNIDNFVFGPATLNIAVGTTVTWVNRDDIPHSVVADDKSFKSKVLDTDGRFSFTFTRPGEFGYFCGLHPHMVGKVIVKAG